VSPVFDSRLMQSFFATFPLLTGALVLSTTGPLSPLDTEISLPLSPQDHTFFGSVVPVVSSPASPYSRSQRVPERIASTVFDRFQYYTALLARRACLTRCRLAKYRPLHCNEWPRRSRERCTACRASVWPLPVTRTHPVHRNLIAGRQTRLPCALASTRR
jgi:hypothetical protein